MLVCIQCTMKAMLEGKEPPTFFETQEEHMREHHPDPERTKRERIDIERRLAERFSK